MSLSRFYDVLRERDGSRYIEAYVTGFQLMHLPLLNKGTAFTDEERTLLDLHGLLPPRIDTLKRQIDRNYRRYSSLEDPLEQHSFLRVLQDTNEVLFFAILHEHLEEMLPIIYTPTVGEAVKRFSAMYLSPRGLTLSIDSIDHASEAVNNVPLDDVRMIVATDASAILGIGDQGLGGMAISIGKLAIYTAGGGIGPDKVLPVELDVGTNRDSLREDPNYLGADRARLTGKPYRNFIDRFVDAVKQRYPKAVIQWEDFAKDSAFAVLERYRNVVPSFNDDIQGTGAMALAGVLSACRIKGEQLQDQRFLISGAGAGGIGVAEILLQGLEQTGLTREEALSRMLVLDSRGVLTTDRELEQYKQAYAHDPAFLEGLGTAANAGLASLAAAFKATALIGLSGQGGQFSRDLIETVHANTPRPIIFPLSNPTENTEVLPADAFEWTGGHALVAAGSPFPPVKLNGETFPVAQGNNAFVFPGLGFGSVLSRAHTVTDNMILAAAYALADYTADRHPDRLYPPVAELQQASIVVTARVMAAAVQDGVAGDFGIYELDEHAMVQFVRERFWRPEYLPYRLPAS